MSKAREIVERMDRGYSGLSQQELARQLVTIINLIAGDFAKLHRITSKQALECLIVGIAIDQTQEVWREFAMRHGEEQGYIK